MTEAIAITVASIVLGAVLGGLGRRGGSWQGPLRTFAVAAVGTAVVVQLLPESVAEIGGGALVVFVVALAVPGLVAPLVRSFRPSSTISSHHVGTELGFYGFVAHQLVEGLALGTVAGYGQEHGGHTHQSLVIAVAAHTLPLTALFVAEARAHYGRASALRRATAVVVATVVGFALADVVQERLHADLHTWLGAGIAGLLVHVIFHHDHGPRHRRRPWVGSLDVLGATVGAALPLLAVAQGGDHGEVVRSVVGEAFFGLLFETAPLLMLGLLLGALVQLVGARMPSRGIAGNDRWGGALRGIAIGAQRPLWAGRVLPTAESLRERGAGPALVMGFLVAAPALGLETLTLSAGLLGWPFAVLRLIAAVALALVVAVAFARLVDAAPRSDPNPGEELWPGAGADGRIAARVYGHFDELVLHIVPWTFVGLLAAAFVQAVLRGGSLTWSTESGVDVLVVVAVALPAYVCAASAMPLAAVLVLEGVSPGAVMGGLLLGPATNLATIGVLRRSYGTRVVLLGVAVTLVVALAMAYAADLAGVPARIPARLGQGDGHPLLGVGAAVLLGVVLLAQLWRWGLRPWLEVLERSRSHGHGHDHGHEHDHGSPGHEHRH